MKLPIADYQKLVQMAHDCIKFQVMVRELQEEFAQCKQEVVKLRILVEHLRKDSFWSKNYEQKEKVG